MVQRQTKIFSNLLVNAKLFSTLIISLLCECFTWNVEG